MTSALLFAGGIAAAVAAMWVGRLMARKRIREMHDQVATADSPFLLDQDTRLDRSFVAYLRLIRGRRDFVLRLAAVAALGAATWIDNGPTETAVAFACGLALVVAWYPIWRGRQAHRRQR